MRGFRPPRPTGTTPFARFQTWVYDELTQRLQFHDSSTVNFNVGTRGITADAAPATAATAATPATLTAFLFIQEFGDYIVGQNQLTGAQVNIAKPYKHRNSVTVERIDSSTWNITYPQNTTGNSLAFVSRTVTRAADGYFEYERISPPWVGASTGIPADVFYAIQMTNTGVTDASSQPVTWLDMNLDGRAWAVTPDGRP